MENMTRLESLARQYKCDPQFSKAMTGQAGFKAGFIAARRMVSVMAQIAQIEGKPIEETCLMVGEEQLAPTDQAKSGMPLNIIDKFLK
jgi:hypothetical protein